jgi:hypothetical protein
VLAWFGCVERGLWTPDVPPVFADAFLATVTPPVFVVPLLGRTAASPRGGSTSRTSYRVRGRSKRHSRGFEPHFETERYVFVGTDETDSVVETVSDWTVQSVTDAATAADWRLGTTSSTDDD